MWGDEAGLNELIPSSGINSVVGSEGFEPPKALPADLQSAPFGHLGNCPRCKLSGKPTAGLEPATLRLQGACSAG